MQPRPAHYLDELEVGMHASIRKTISEQDVRTFADISGDHNPVHTDPEYARHTPFGKCVAHGMFSAALISAVAGTKLPGPGAVYVDQQIRFKAPIFIGDEVEAEVRIEEINERLRLVVCKTQVRVGDRVVATGEARFRVDKRPAA